MLHNVWQALSYTPVASVPTTATRWSRASSVSSRRSASSSYHDFAIHSFDSPATSGLYAMRSSRGALFINLDDEPPTPSVARASTPSDVPTFAIHDDTTTESYETILEEASAAAVTKPRASPTLHVIVPSEAPPAHESRSVIEALALQSRELFRSRQLSNRCGRRHSESPRLTSTGLAPATSPLSAGGRTPPSTKAANMRSLCADILIEQRAIRSEVRAAV